MIRTALMITLCLPLSVVAAEKAKTDDGFVPLFDGKTLDGWHSGKSHGDTKGWRVENGAIIGTQDRPGNGGILLTDKQFGDFEVSLEMNNDYGPDSGLFLRSNDRGQCYQALVDYHGGGSLMGLYGEGLSPGFHLYNFSFGDTPDKITENKSASFPLPVKPDQWPKFWKHGQWNEFRARIVGNPPALTTWINGVKFFEWTDTIQRHPDKGSLGVQVHGGGDFTKQFVRYRNIRVKELPVPAAGK